MKIQLISTPSSHQAQRLTGLSEDLEDQTQAVVEFLKGVERMEQRLCTLAAARVAIEARAHGATELRAAADAEQRQITVLGEEKRNCEVKVYGLGVRSRDAYQVISDEFFEWLMQELPLAVRAWAHKADRPCANPVALADELGARAALEKFLREIIPLPKMGRAVQKEFQYAAWVKGLLERFAGGEVVWEFEPEASNASN